MDAHAEYEFWQNFANLLGLERRPFLADPLRVVRPERVAECILDAACYAAEKHAGQRRKDAAGTPYVNHPLRVARILERVGIDDPRVLQAAVLHDVVEDCFADRPELGFNHIRGLFGDVVEHLVREVTDDRSLTKEQRKRAQVVKVGKISPHARMIKLADKLDNLSDLLTNAPRSWTVEQIQGYFVWCHAVVSASGYGSSLGLSIIQALSRTFEGSFERDGVRHPAIPPQARADMGAALERYYASLSAAPNPRPLSPVMLGEQEAFALLGRAAQVEPPPAPVGDRLELPIRRVAEATGFETRRAGELEATLSASEELAEMGEIVKSLSAEGRKAALTFLRVLKQEDDRIARK